MQNILKLIRVNLKILLNSKKTAILLILGPLLLVSLAVLAFDNSNSYNLRLGIFAESPTDLGSAYIKSLKDNDFKIVRFKEEDSCINSLKKGDTHSCIVFKHGEKDEIFFYVDYSKLSLVSELESVMGYEASKKAEEIGGNLTNELLAKLEATKKEISDNRDIIISLTTDNEDINKQIQDLSSHLSQLNLRIKLDLSNESLSVSESNFLSWVDSINSQTSEIIQKYRDMADAVESRLRNSAISEGDQLEVAQILSDGKDELRVLSERLRITTDITSSDVGDLTDMVNGVVQNIENLESQLNSLSGFKHTSTVKLNRIQHSLDQNLIKYIALQNVFNNIENNINSIEISEDSFNPIKTVIKPVSSVKTKFNYVFPVILVLIVMFTGILLSSTLVILERESPAYFRNFMSPTKKSTFTLSLFLTSFLILSIQFLVLIVIASFFLGKSILLNLHTFMFSLSVVVSTFALLGMVIGNFFRTEEMAIFAGVSVSSLLLVFSDLILPLESMPVYLSAVFQYNPFVVSIAILKKILLFDLSFSFIIGNLLVLIAYILIFILCIALAFRPHSKRFK